MKRIKEIEKDKARLFFGHFEENIRKLEEDYGVTIAGRGNQVIIKGPRKKVLAALTEIEERLKRLGPRSDWTPEAIEREAEIDEQQEVYTGSKKHLVRAKSKGQESYIKAIRKKDIVVGIGPAGTGKTYLAVALAIEYLKKHRVERVIISRPAIEAGEKLGFLPGDLEEKIKPYLQPIYDALYDFMWPEEIRQLMEHRVIEILPLAYMRGRTLSEAFIILDEAQNATPEQMKMLLTRLGLGSRAIITGDTTQSDLPREQTSGLSNIEGFLKKVSGIEFVYLDETDVVRHPLVKEIILAYAEEGNRNRTLPPEQAKEDKGGPGKVKAPGNKRAGSKRT